MYGFPKETPLGGGRSTLTSPDHLSSSDTPAGEAAACPLSLLLPGSLTLPLPHPQSLPRPGDVGFDPSNRANSLTSRVLQLGGAIELEEDARTRLINKKLCEIFAAAAMTSASAGAVPTEFLDPVTGEIMLHPVITKEGVTMDRRSAEAVSMRRLIVDAKLRAAAAVAAGSCSMQAISPRDMKKIANAKPPKLVPNNALHERIQKWRKKVLGLPIVEEGLKQLENVDASSLRAKSRMQEMFVALKQLINSNKAASSSSSPSVNDRSTGSELLSGHQSPPVLQAATKAANVHAAQTAASRIEEDARRRLARIAAQGMLSYVFLPTEASQEQLEQIRGQLVELQEDEEKERRAIYLEYCRALYVVEKSFEKEYETVLEAVEKRLRAEESAKAGAPFSASIIAGSGGPLCMEDSLNVEPSPRRCSILSGRRASVVTRRKSLITNPTLLRKTSMLVQDAAPPTPSAHINELMTTIAPPYTPPEVALPGGLNSPLDPKMRPSIASEMGELWAGELPALLVVRPPARESLHLQTQLQSFNEEVSFEVSRDEGQTASSSEVSFKSLVAAYVEHDVEMYMKRMATIRRRIEKGHGRTVIPHCTAEVQTARFTELLVRHHNHNVKPTAAKVSHADRRKQSSFASNNLVSKNVKLDIMRRRHPNLLAMVAKEQRDTICPSESAANPILSQSAHPSSSEGVPSTTEESPTRVPTPARSLSSPPASALLPMSLLLAKPPPDVAALIAQVSTSRPSSCAWPSRRATPISRSEGTRCSPHVWTKQPFVPVSLLPHPPNREHPEKGRGGVIAAKYAKEFCASAVEHLPFAVDP